MKTRWSSINLLIQRLFNTKACFCILPATLMCNLERLHNGTRLTLPTKLLTIISDASVMDYLAQAEGAIDRICKTLSACEFGTAALTTLLPALLYTRVYISNAKWLTSVEKFIFLNDLVRQSLGILSDVLYLPFARGLFFTAMHARITKRCGAPSLSFGKPSLSSHCRNALRLLCHNDAHYKLLLKKLSDIFSHSR